MLLRIYINQIDHFYNETLMEVVFLMLMKIKDKSGGSAIETVLVVMLVFPLIIMFIVGAFTFFNVHSQNVNINFDAGRYVSTTGCSLDKLQDSMPGLTKFNGFNIFVNGTKIQSGSKGDISITCQAASQSGDEFNVITSMPVYNIKFFPINSARSANYVQE